MTAKWDAFTDLYIDFMMEQAYWYFASYIEEYNEEHHLFTSDELEDFIEWCDITPTLTTDR